MEHFDFDDKKESAIEFKPQSVQQMLTQRNPDFNCFTLSQQVATKQNLSWLVANNHYTTADKVQPTIKTNL